MYKKEIITWSHDHDHKLNFQNDFICSFTYAVVIVLRENFIKIKLDHFLHIFVSYFRTMLIHGVYRICQCVGRKRWPLCDLMGTPILYVSGRVTPLALGQGRYLCLRNWWTAQTTYGMRAGKNIHFPRRKSNCPQFLPFFHAQMSFPPIAKISFQVHIFPRREPPSFPSFSSPCMGYWHEGIKSPSFWIYQWYKECIWEWGLCMGWCQSVYHYIFWEIMEKRAKIVKKNLVWGQCLKTWFDFTMHCLLASRDTA